MLDENTKNLNTENLTDDATSTPKSESPESDEQTTSKIKKEKKIEVDDSKIKKKVKEAKDKSSDVKLETKKSEKEEVQELTDKVEDVEKGDNKNQNLEKVEYDSLNLEQLVQEFQKLLKEDNIQNIKNKIEKIKLSFNKKFSDLLKEKKEAFLAEGGNEIDFHYTNPSKTLFKDLLFEFKTKRQRFYNLQEEEQKENLIKRLALIEDLKQLIDNAEPATMYGHFKELQDKWRVIGKIPRAKYNDTWRTYHHHVERFYDLLHLSNDFRDLDFKNNLEEKLKLVEKAEELAESNDLNKAFKELQVLHKLWKEEIGPVAREHREEIWERFSNATKKIHDKRHDFQRDLESKYEDNIILKREIIEKISILVDDEKIDSHKAWQQKINELELLRQEFFKIGKVPRAVSEKIWKEFKESTRKFNRIKNNFYKSIKNEQHENLNKKNALVEKAEALMDSEDFDSTTEIMKQIQAEWKTIGHVPRKYSDKIWKRFKDACNHYFDRLHNIQDEVNKDQVDVFNKKKELLGNLKSQAEGKEALTLEVINTYVDDWQKLGKLPNNMRHLDAKFNKLLYNLYEKLDLDEKEISMLKFKNVVNTYLANNNARKLDSEQLFVRKKIDELTREIQQLENNVSFFSNAEDDNPLLKNVHNNIDNYNKELEIWKTKLDYLTNIEY
ncbi:MAG: DUF349 domain-containing protein [Aureibaculum sp.]